MFGKIRLLQAEAQKRFLQQQCWGRIDKSFSFVGIYAGNGDIFAVAESGDGNVASPGAATRTFFVISAQDDFLKELNK